MLQLLTYLISIVTTNSYQSSEYQMQTNCYYYLQKLVLFNRNFNDSCLWFRLNYTIKPNNPDRLAECFILQYRKEKME